jgi:hypothetical protein
MIRRMPQAAAPRSSRRVARRAAAAAAAAAALLLGSAGPARAGGVPGDLLSGREPLLVDAVGEPLALTDGRLLPEGAPPSGGVRLASPSAAVVADLGAVHRVGALLVQGSGNAVLFVEAAVDVDRFVLAARLAPVLLAADTRTRTVVLPRAVPARWLRIRATSGWPVTLTELAAYEDPPGTWPTLDRSRGDAPLPFFPMMTLERAAALALALSGLLLAGAAWSVAASVESRGQRRARRAALVALAAASLAAWPNALNFRYRTPLHHWEFAHYYLGAKYFPELGYTLLYACADLVDAEDAVAPPDRPVRDLRDDRVVTAAADPARAAECRASFSAERWAAFRQDARYFRTALGPAWADWRLDHGFNATPAWTMLGRVLASVAPASDRTLAVLALVDVLLLAAILAVVGATFGLEAACLAAGFFGLNALAGYSWTGGAFLRYDWLACLVAGIAALRTGRAALGGFALAYATALRVFPGVALAGLALKTVVEVVETRSLAPLRARAPLAAGAALAALLFGVVPALTAGRANAWGEFAGNSARHLKGEAANLVGLPVALAFDRSATLELTRDPLLADPAGPWAERRRAAREETVPAHRAAVAAFVVVLALAVRRVPDWAAAALGLTLMPMLFALSCYYYSAFVALAALGVLGGTPTVALAALAWTTNALGALFPADDVRYAAASFVTVALAVVLAASFARRGPARSGPGPG